tara:strand:- start:1508 stop:5152 length:3645 start_codon:yes stop_codon:yes gene_type:complete
MSNNDEIMDKIEEITTVLSKGDFDSIKEKKHLQRMLEELYQPATDMQTVRFQILGQRLYATTLDGSGYEAGSYSAKKTLPILRASKKRLLEFLQNLEHLGVLPQAIYHDRVIRGFPSTQRKQVTEIIQQVENTTSRKKKDMYLTVLATLIYEKCMWLLEQEKVPVSINKQVLSYILAYTNSDGVDYTTLGEAMVKKYQGSNDNPDGNTWQTLENLLFEDTDTPSMSVTTSMLYWSEPPTRMRKSQKAKGIQKIGLEIVNSKIWDVEPSLFLSLDDALEIHMGELLQSISACFSDRSTKSLLKQGLFIRTCPASPRPGALENVLAHTPVELRDGLRYLAEGMLDKDGADYDPEGCLCIMPFIQPTCSGVLVKGHHSLIVGPAHDGVTAGGGSNIILTLNHNLVSQITNQIHEMQLDDGMEHHELEFVFRKSENITLPAHIKKIRKASRVIWESVPIITQIRGLHEGKQPLQPPPTLEVDGEMHTLHIRGNIPTGSIVQETFIDVGKGDLSDCIELEQMAEKGELPQGLVVYCSSGSPNAHVAGVGVQWEIPVLYCVTHADGTKWTEIDGWVTTLDNVTPNPYDPALFKEYFIMGCEDGDRFWEYQNQALSQFLHTYMNNPINDARLEAYLGGVYASWILKATLAVAIGEGRHAYTSTKAKYKPIHGLIHIFISKVLQSEQEQFNPQEWMDRAWYYIMFQNKEIGLENIMDMFKAYERLFSECKWPGSYGGKNYAESVQKGLLAAKAIYDFQHNDGDFKTVLGTINTLENAVHNCSFFFNKFIADKKFFDIGTSNHMSMKRIEWQYLVAVGFHYRFYKYRVSEPEKISPFYKEAFQSTFHEYRIMNPEYSDITSDVFAMIHDTSESDTISHILDKHPQVKNMIDSFSKLYGSSNYCEDCDSYECGCYPSVKTFHHEGLCGWSGCGNPKCKEQSLLEHYGIKSGEINSLSKLFMLQGNQGNMFNDKPFSLYTKTDGILNIENGLVEEEYWEDLFQYELNDTSNANTHDKDATVFTEATREIVTKEQEWKIYTEEDFFKPEDGQYSMIDDIVGELPAPIILKKKGFGRVVFAQGATNVLIRFMRERFASIPTTTLIKDLKDVKSGLNSPLDWEIMELISLVHEKLAVPHVLLKSSTNIPTMTALGQDWRSGMTAPSIVQLHLKGIYANMLIGLISERIKTDNPHYNIYTYIGAGQNAQTIFDILLSEFDLDFVKEVLQ